jgi:glycosyltransferase involved in cell wall biosynthesis
MLPLIINWPLSSRTGYGIYGLHILLQYLKRGGKEFALTDHLILPIDLPQEIDAQLRPLLEKAAQAAVLLDKNPSEVLRFDGVVLYGVGNCYSSFKNQFRVRGRRNVGCAAIEEAICPADWLPFLEIYDMFAAASTWTGDFLSSLNIAPVHVCRLGVDPSVFHVAPQTRIFGDRFVIFSGGKFEFRKGQDIIVAAFKRFRERHPDALLVTSWQSTHAVDAVSFASAGHCSTVPARAETGMGLKISEWLQAQGLPLDSFVDLGWLHNKSVPDFLHSCDIAIFPNRCEGGTNMVAKETLACGLPTYVAGNTGQADLIELVGCGAFSNQMPLKPVPGIESVEGWRETDVEEVVAVLEHAYSNKAEERSKALICAEKMKEWSWSDQNEKLLQRVYDSL